MNNKEIEKIINKIEQSGYKVISNNFYNNIVEGTIKDKEEIARLNEENKLFKKLYSETLEEKDQLSNIIDELEKDMEEKYHKEIDYQSKIMQSGLMQGDYPISYYYSEQNEKLFNYYLNKLKELKEEGKE